jgi:hypothetical protein
LPKKLKKKANNDADDDGELYDVIFEEEELKQLVNFS